MATKIMRTESNNQYKEKNKKERMLVSEGILFSKGAHTNEPNINPTSK